MPASTPARWRGRTAGLAAALLVVGAIAVLLTAGGRAAAPAFRLVLTDGDGRQLAALELPADRRFTLRYRNSLYDSAAEERFSVNADGQLVLEQLAADERAVLAEYYAALLTRPAASGDRRRHVAGPALAVVLEELTVAATDRGRRTLLVEGQAPVQLWRFVDDADPSVTLRVERTDG